MDDGLPLAWAPKAAVYLLSQLAIGLLVVHRLSPPPDPWTSAWQRRLAIVVSAFLLVALAFRLWVQSASAFGVADAALSENLRLIGIESRWGGNWRLQIYAAAAMLVMSLLLGAGRAAWLACGASAAGLCLVMPLLGHAGGSVVRQALHAIHNLGAASWLGTVGVLAMSAWRRPAAAGADTLATAVRRFSPMALTCATFVFTTGLIVAWIYVGSPAALWSTAYGQALLLKLAGVAGVGVCGWINWRGVRRGAPPNRLVMSVEWAAAVVVLALTAQLTETEHP